MASSLTGAPNTGGMGSDFRPICGYIWETVIDRSIFTIADEYKVVGLRTLSNSAAFNDLDSWNDPESKFQQ